MVRRLGLTLECFWLIIEKIISSPALKSLGNYNDIFRISRTNLYYEQARRNSSKDFSSNSFNEEDFQSSLEFSKSNELKKHNQFSNLKSPKSKDLNSKSMNFFKTNSKEPNCEIDSKFIEKHRTVLLTTYKYYCNLTNCTNQIFLSYSTFVRMMKDCKVLENKEIESNSSFDLPFNLKVKQNSKPNPLNETSRRNVLSYETINLLFSKFSSENDPYVNDKLNSKENYLFYKSSYYNFKTNKHSYSKDQTRSFSNKRVSFMGFMKILVCISNKLFNPLHKEEPFGNKKKLVKIAPINIELLLNVEPHNMYAFLENFISLYFVPIYTDIKAVFEGEFNDFKILHEIINDEVIVTLILKEDYVRHKIQPSFEQDISALSQ
jgi:hypothetical protein